MNEPTTVQQCLNDDELPLSYGGIQHFWNTFIYQYIPDKSYEAAVLESYMNDGRWIGPWIRNSFSNEDVSIQHYAVLNPLVVVGLLGINIDLFKEWGEEYTENNPNFPYEIFNDPNMFFNFPANQIMLMLEKGIIRKITPGGTLI